MPTTINIYVQALGGKFLGPNALNPQLITITVSYNGQTVNVPYYDPTQTYNDGIINNTFTSGSTSPMPILQQQAAGGPVVNYLTPGEVNNTPTVFGQAVLEDITDNTVATITVSVPVPIGNPLVFTQQLSLSTSITNYTTFVPIPGLLLQQPQFANNQLSVYVKMMCGCKVTVGLPTSYWYEGDFSVTAILTYENGATQPVTMNLDTATNDSWFTATINPPETVVWVSFIAQQESTGNSGWSFWNS